MRPCSLPTRLAAGVVAVTALTTGLLPMSSAQAASVSASTWAELTAAFAAGGSVRLGADISAPSGGLLQVSGAVQFDLMGHALSITEPSPDAAQGVHVPFGTYLTITDSAGGGTLTSVGGRYSAGIGGSLPEPGSPDTDSHINSGAVTVRGGTVTATGGDTAAGVGGGIYGASGPLVVSGGTLVARGGDHATGIGGGVYGYGNVVSVSGGTVIAQGGEAGSGIGGDGDAGTLSVTGGSVSATGGAFAPGFGPNFYSLEGRNTTGTVEIGPAGAFTVAHGDPSVAVSGTANAIGGGTNSTATITVRNAGTLTLPGGVTWTIPSDATVTNTGTLTGTGTLVNHGTIAGTGTVSDVARGGTLQVGGTNDYLLSFDTGSSGTAPAPRSVYAPSVAAGGGTLPTPTLAAGYGLIGWFTAPTGGTRVTDDTDLAAAFGATGPRAATLYARIGLRPVVATIAPATGPTAGGTKVTVAGRNFTGTTTVTVDGAAVPFTVASDTKLMLTTPAHAPGAAALTVVNAAGGSAPKTASTFTYVVSTFDQLAAAFAAGGSVPLGADITAPAGRNLVAGSVPVTLDLRGRALTVDAPETGSAAIAVAGGSALTVVDSVGGGRVTAAGGDSAAAIGGGPGAAGGAFTLGGGSVTATGGVNAAGVGGGNGAGGGTVSVTGGSLTATGGVYGAGVGGGKNAAGATVAVTGGAVTARGGDQAAGVGGGYNGAGGVVTVGPGSLTAVGGVQGAGVGSGVAPGGPLGGGSLVVAAGGSVTASGGERAGAIGAGVNSTDLGVLRNAGTITIPAGATLRVPTDAVVTNTGTFTGGGTVANAGTIVNSGGGSVSDAARSGSLTVTGNDYRVVFDLAGNPGTAPAPLLVYGPTTSATGQSFLKPPARAGYAFTGWFTAASGGTQFLATNVLSKRAGVGPATLTLYARYTARPVVTAVSPASGPTTGGQTVTLTGTGFTGVTAVTFGAAKATGVTVVSATSITAVVPAGAAAGTVAVAVVTPAGTSAAATAARYTYTAPAPR